MKEIFKQIKQFNFDYDFKDGEYFEFILNPKEAILGTDALRLLDGHTYRIKVRPYMTQPATSNYDFMDRYNNNIPMPTDTMSGEVLKSNRSMVYMRLWDVITKTNWEGWIIRRGITEFKEISNEG